MAGRIPVGDREEDVSQLADQGPTSLGEPSSSRVGGSALSVSHHRGVDTAASPNGRSGFAADDGVSSAPAESDETIRKEPTTPRHEGDKLSVQKGTLTERLSKGGYDSISARKFAGSNNNSYDRTENLNRNRIERSEDNGDCNGDGGSGGNTPEPKCLKFADGNKLGTGGLGL